VIAPWREFSSPSEAQKKQRTMRRLIWIKWDVVEAVNLCLKSR
jgi:hypothetical protein